MTARPRKMNNQQLSEAQENARRNWNKAIGRLNPGGPVPRPSRRRRHRPPRPWPRGGPS